MSKQPDTTAEILDLRSRAEEEFKSKMADMDLPRSEEEMLKLVHDLQIHQIELEMQNDELRRSEEELMVARDKFSFLYDFAPMGYFTLDRETVIRTVNLAGATLLGMERSRIVNLPFNYFVATSDRPAVSDFFQKVFEGKEKQTCEVKFSEAGGQPLFVRIEAVAADSGQECLAAVVDITALRQMGKELQESLEALEREMAECKLLEHRLIQAQKMEAMGQLAGGVAHDFNNLLIAISGYGEEIRDGLPAGDESLQECVGQLLHGAERAAELTRQLLAFSRKQKIDQKPVLIDDIIANASKLMQRVIGEDIGFATELCCKGMLVMASAGQIEQVLLNLATNARGAMPDGGQLSISTQKVVVKEGSEAEFDLLLPGTYVLISVSDTGTGIDKKIIDRVFEPFFTTKEVGEGTGLGLSMVYGIVKQHRGSVLVSSETGEGTTFKIYLPLLEDHKVTKEIKRPFSLAGGTETLLVVEDEEIVKLFLKRTLEKAGYRTLAAGDGEEAMTLFREHDDISLVLSDMVMPRKNGKELLAEVRQIKPEMKFIFISGYTANIMDSEGVQQAGLEFIRKPFSKNDILGKVREVLDRQ
ncbi:MAG: ATP-binding protein [Geobacteraceae bacterium]|nr:ATP-binding protein [Geobacteraceae bacterium]